VLFSFIINKKTEEKMDKIRQKLIKKFEKLYIPFHYAFVIYDQKGTPFSFCTDRDYKLEFEITPINGSQNFYDFEIRVSDGRIESLEHIIKTMEEYIIQTFEEENIHALFIQNYYHAYPIDLEKVKATTARSKKLLEYIKIIANQKIYFHKGIFSFEEIREITFFFHFDDECLTFELYTDLNSEDTNVVKIENDEEVLNLAEIIKKLLEIRKIKSKLIEEFASEYTIKVQRHRWISEYSFNKENFFSLGVTVSYHDGNLKYAYYFTKELKLNDIMFNNIKIEGKYYESFEFMKKEMDDEINVFKKAIRLEKILGLL
jgi:hypothetical protein